MAAVTPSPVTRPRRLGDVASRRRAPGGANTCADRRRSIWRGARDRVSASTYDCGPGTSAQAPPFGAHVWTGLAVEPVAVLNAPPRRSATPTVSTGYTKSRPVLTAPSQTTRSGTARWNPPPAGPGICATRSLTYAGWNPVSGAASRTSWLPSPGDFNADRSPITPIQSRARSRRYQRVCPDIPSAHARLGTNTSTRRHINHFQSRRARAPSVGRIRAQIPEIPAEAGKSES